MSDQDELGKYLADGWEVCGYSVCLMALGATSQHILLKKGTSLATCIVVNNGGNELGRGVVMLSPPAPPAQKKGFWG
jgi:hypothetical protein